MCQHLDAPDRRDGCFLGIENIHLLPNPVKPLTAKRSLRLTDIVSALLDRVTYELNEGRIKVIAVGIEDVCNRRIDRLQDRW